jgi:hypothetical protein
VGNGRCRLVNLQSAGAVERPNTVARRARARLGRMVIAGGASTAIQLPKTYVTHALWLTRMLSCHAAPSNKSWITQTPSRYSDDDTYFLIKYCTPILSLSIPSFTLEILYIFNHCLYYEIPSLPPLFALK